MLLFQWMPRRQKFCPQQTKHCCPANKLHELNFPEGESLFLSQQKVAAKQASSFVLNHMEGENPLCSRQSGVWCHSGGNACNEKTLQLLATDDHKLLDQLLCMLAQREFLWSQQNKVLVFAFLPCL
jgi:hypothetical protein